MTVAMPSSFSMEERRNQLVISRRWFSLRKLPAVIACGILLVVLISAFLSEPVPGLPPMTIVTLLMGAIYLFFLYKVLADLFNFTEFCINRSMVSVKHGPFWWPGNREVSTRSIDQLYCEEEISTVRVNGHRREKITYTVMLIDAKTRERLKLVSGIAEPEHARFIEQEIERFLGIEDRPVSGEMSARPRASLWRNLFRM